MLSGSKAYNSADFRIRLSSCGISTWKNSFAGSLKPLWVGVLVTPVKQSLVKVEG